MVSLFPSYGSRVQTSQARQRQEQTAYRQQMMPLTKMREASALAAAEAEKSRQYEAEQSEVAYGRAKEFASSIFDQYWASSGSDTGQGAAQTALEAAITQRGGESQARLSSLLARRGIFQSGAGAAAAGKMAGETEAQVAQSRAAYAESEASRQSREREAAINQALQAFQIGGQY